MEKESDINFEELSNDEDIIKRLTNFSNAVDKIEEGLKFANDPELYGKLSNAEKIKFNLLMSFSLNGLFWMYLRAEGIDPTKHQIKSENERLKQMMARAKQLHDRNTIMPRIDKEAAQRFVRSGLWTPGQNKDAENAGESSKLDESGENWD